MWAYTHHMWHPRVICEFLDTMHQFYHRSGWCGPTDIIYVTSWVWCSAINTTFHHRFWCGLIYAISVPKDFDVGLYTSYMSPQSLMLAYTRHICYQRIWCGLKHTISVTPEFDVGLYTPYISPQSLMWAYTHHICHQIVWCGLIHTLSVT